MSSVTTHSASIDPSAPEPAPANVSAPPERFHQLDGLRAVAVGLVMFHHLLGEPLKLWLANHGFVYFSNLLAQTTGSGVELFFVLSGVVLLRPYLRGRRKFNTNSYLRRRVERLFPPYLVALGLEALLAFVYIRFPTWVTRENPHAEFSFTGVAQQLGIVSFGWPHYNVAWWSLSVEGLFYLIVPLLLPLFAWRKMDRLFFAAMAILCMALGIWINRWVDFARPNAWTSFQHLAVYSSCFLLGIAIAKYDWPRSLGWAMVIFGTIYILLATAEARLDYHIGYGFLYGGVIILAWSPRTRLAKTLSSPLMLWIGERSYSLFLIHFTAFFTVNYLISFATPGKNAVYLATSRIGGLAAAVFGAMLMFQFIERRFARNLVTANQFWPPGFRTKPPE
ncbi:MAG: acyltransferase [Anaerolineae bacterium]|nr:acyltransferase [Phycisphaerae bacterium]